MIDAIKIKNLTTEAEIFLGKTAGNPYMLETNGLSWNTADATHNTYTNLTGIGDIVTSTKIDTRTIDIVGMVCCPYTTKELCEQYNLMTRGEMREKRLELINNSKTVLSQILNPLETIEINIGDFHITGKPDSSVMFSGLWEENNEIYCKFTVSISCHSPLFTYKTSKRSTLSGVYGGFHFPVRIPKNKGMHFGIIIPYQLVAIDNMGDIPIGAVIHFEAIGPVENPTITEVYTQSTIKIDKTMSVGEIIEIDTSNRTVKGSTNSGTTFENYLQYWDFDSDWTQFPVGTSLLGYSADADTQRNLLVYVELEPMFYSLGEQ